MLVSRRASDLKVEIVMREGNVVREILAQAGDSRADLVVIGSHGRGGVQRLVLGSVAEKVLRQATCPVLTIRRGVSRPRRNRSPFKTILCPTDLSAAGNNAVAYAKRLARAAGARLIVMSAVEWPFGVAVTSGPVAELQDGLEANARKALARLLPRPGLTAQRQRQSWSTAKPAPPSSSSPAPDRPISSSWVSRVAAHWMSSCWDRRRIM